MSHLCPNIYTQVSNWKLAPKWAGPYKIIDCISQVSYKLNLPPLICIHSIFHSNILWLYFTANDNWQPKWPPPIIIDLEPEYEVKSILDHWTWHCKMEYLILWKDYPWHEATWELIKHLTHVSDLLNEYHNRLHIPFPTSKCHS